MRVLAENRSAIARITASGSHPSWDTFVESLETLDERLHRTWSPATHLNAVMNSPDIRKAYNACLPKLRHTIRSSARTNICNAVIRRSRLARNGKITPCAAKLIEDALRDFRLAGVDLPPEKKGASVPYAGTVTTRSRFEENLLDATQGWFKQVTDVQRLAVSRQWRWSARRGEAESRQLQGWVFTLDHPAYSAVITHADDRILRQEMYRAYVTRASDQGPTRAAGTTAQVCAASCGSRHEAAELTGFTNFAAYSLADKMAAVTGGSDRASSRTWWRVPPPASTNSLESRHTPWNGMAWSSSLPGTSATTPRSSRRSATTSPRRCCALISPAPQVTRRPVPVMQKLYGLSFSEVSGADVWHPDVKLYALHDDAGELRGRLYIDLYARNGKRGGAWMDETLGRRRTSQGLQTPVAFLNCNFPPPLAGTPSLLTHDDVVTLFHELGHCLHHLLTRVDYPSVGGHQRRGLGRGGTAEPVPRELRLDPGGPRAGERPLSRAVHRCRKRSIRKC